MFSQESVNNFFDKRSRHSGVLIGETLDDICEGRCSIHDIPTVRVMKRGGKWVTADNRRLWVFRELERLGKCDEIPVCETYYIAPEKLNSENGGVSVRVRRHAGGRWHNKPSVRRPDPKKDTTRTLNHSHKSQDSTRLVSKTSALSFPENAYARPSVIANASSAYSKTARSSGTTGKTPSPNYIEKPKEHSVWASGDSHAVDKASNSFVRKSTSGISSSRVQGVRNDSAIETDQNHVSIQIFKTYSESPNRALPATYEGPHGDYYGDTHASHSTTGSSSVGVGSHRHDAVYPYFGRDDGFLGPESGQSNFKKEDGFLSHGSGQSKFGRDGSTLDQDSRRSNSTRKERPDSSRVNLYMYDADAEPRPVGQCPCTILWLYESFNFQCPIPHIASSSKRAKFLSVIKS